MVYRIPGSQFWSDIDMMINWFKLSPTIDREYVLKGLSNMKTLGYRIVKRNRPARGVRANKRTTTKTRRKAKYMGNCQKRG